MLSLAVIEDFYHMKISNKLILAGLFLAIIYQVATQGVDILFSVLWNILFPIIVLYLFYLVHALGAGDIKLLSVVGGFINFKELVICIAISFAIGAMIAFGKMLYYRSFLCSIRKGTRYILEQAMGRREVYEKDFLTKRNLIHFSFAILLGTVAGEWYVGGF